MSKLISNTLLAKVPNLYETENVKDPTCHIKLFTPDSNWTWFIIEFDKKDNQTCFGYVIGHECELGYFNLKEIEELKGPLGLAVELDTNYTPTLLSKVKESN